MNIIDFLTHAKGLTEREREELLSDALDGKCAVGLVGLIAMESLQKALYVIYTDEAGSAHRTGAPAVYFASGERDWWTHGTLIRSTRYQ